MDQKEQIQQTVECYQQLVHTQDRQAFDRLFAHQGTCRLISGARLFEGRERIYQDFLIGCIRQAYERIELIADSVEIEPVGDAMAVVVFRYHTDCLRRGTREPHGIRGLETQVLVQERGEWRILHVHYSIDNR